MTQQYILPCSLTATVHSPVPSSRGVFREVLAGGTDGSFGGGWEGSMTG